MKQLRMELIMIYSKKIKKSLSERGFFRTPSPIGGFIEYYLASDYDETYSIFGEYSNSNQAVATNIIFVATEMAKNHFRKIACRSSMSYDKATWMWYNIDKHPKPRPLRNRRKGISK